MNNLKQPAFPVMHPNGTFTGYTKEEIARLEIMCAMLSNPSTCEEKSIKDMLDDAKIIAKELLK